MSFGNDRVRSDCAPPFLISPQAISHYLSQIYIHRVPSQLLGEARLLRDDRDIRARDHAGQRGARGRCGASAIEQTRAGGANPAAKSDYPTLSPPPDKWTSASLRHAKCFAVMNKCKSRTSGGTAHATGSVGLRSGYLAPAAARVLVLAEG